MVESNKAILFGLDFCTLTFKEAAALLEKHALNSTGIAKVVVTPNVDHVVRLEGNPELFNIYRQADFIFPDGFPVALCAKLLGKGFKERVTGADLFTELCERFSHHEGSVFVLGGRPGEENEIEGHLKRRYFGLEVKVMCPSMHFNPDAEEALAPVQVINDYKPDLVFVCLGMPKQELWALKYRVLLNTRLILCVGAALDFVTGRVQRAPQWMRILRLEWLWRLGSDPGRLWKRYLVEDIAFLRLAFREFRKRSYPR
jgi:N-acetylglucosaminyldiphosphoundecaprenol N-acetyl-beta-D-mannosaminyltransferase